ncbi:MAG: hypothetical protein CK425_10895 [Parachlamydia sp.]|nr:MAG: hypothetical protein CK425_10895 [Parachlamydia sp.]
MSVTPVNVRSIEETVAPKVAHRKVSKGNSKPRLIFDTHNKRADLNIAIAKNPKSMTSNRTWAVLEVKVAGSENSTKVLANINGLSRRLDLSKSEIRAAIKNKTLESLVSQQLEKKMQEIKSQKVEVVSSLQPSQRKLNSFIERLKGAVVDLWWLTTTERWDLFRLRFMLRANGDQLQNEGQLRALTAYRNAYKRVPAYKKHVAENVPKKGATPQLPKRFADIPLTDKKTYIQKVEDVDDLYLDGKLPKSGQLDSSTGTTGEPALWVRSSKELAVTQKLMAFARKAKFGHKDVILLNTFALGLWATGVTVAGAGPKQGLIANVGIVPDYAEKSVTIIKQLTKKNSSKPIVLCGYPPNIRKIADAVQNDPELKKKLDEGKLVMHAIVGGEGMTEELRKDILDKGFSSVFSSYGASDLDINIGYETNTEIAIRQACIDNPALAEELYGGGPPPMIFHYDPLHYFIETTKDNELVYTCCRKERASPRIRYNLHDTGKVMKAEDVCDILKKYGIELKPRTNLPFLFVHGREGTVSYGGSKIHYEHFEQAIRAIDKDGAINVDRFALHKPQEDKLEFWIEASSDEAYNQIKANLNEMQHKLIEQIAEKNTDFQKILDSKSNPYPQIRLFKPKQSIMSKHAELNPHRKLQRVVADSPDIKQQLHEAPDSFVVSTGDYPK